MKNPILLQVSDAFNFIGYEKNNILENYAFNNFYSSDLKNAYTDLAVFARQPYDYRSSCFAVILNKNERNYSQSVKELRALGSPHIFLIENGQTQRWKNNSDKVEYIENIPTNNLSKFIKSNLKIWKPSVILRQKNGFEPPPHDQLHLFVDPGLLPALEHEASRKIDSLIKLVLYDVENETMKLKAKVDPKLIFRIVFKLLTAKLLFDREIKTSPLIDFSNFQSTLQAVINYYNKPDLLIDSKQIPRTILESITKKIGESISLKNLSVDTLTYIYENTFVSPTTRKELGIHSTPSYVAEYILNQLPVDSINYDKWKFFDPTCGHGIFLIAAMRRMRDLLPENWSGPRRHKFFINHLSGSDIDPFSIEVAEMCLTLADFPEANGWNLNKLDIFKGNVLEKTCLNTTFLIGNPPFENMVVNNVEKPKPSVLLNRSLGYLPKNACIGLVLPNSFLDGSDYKRDREMFLKSYNLISVTNLPSNTFAHSSSETSIVIAKKSEHSAKNIYSFREVNKNDLEKFKKELMISWQDEIEQDTILKEKNYTIKIPLYRPIWEILKNLPTIDSIAKIAIGVQHESSKVSPSKDYSETKISNTVSAITSSEDSISTFIVTKTRYIPSDKCTRRRNAWEYDWSKEKVVLPCNRISSGPWKYCAAIDYEGRHVTRNFYAVWQLNQSYSIELICALLNSPIATAFVYTHSTERNITKRVYNKIPIPIGIESNSEEIKKLVIEYIDSINSLDYDKARQLLLIIDSIILDSYQLSPKLQRHILDLFSGYKRPVPFLFERYFEKNDDSWIPLKIKISENYINSIVGTLLNNIPKIQNKELIKKLINIGDEI